MNPVTRRLLDEIDDPELAELALAWDGLEELVVQLYRDGGCTPDQAREFDQRREAGRRAVRRWRRELEPHWRGTRVAGVPLDRSPFDAVLAADRAERVMGNWILMQQLPAAREALNGLLLARARPPVADSLKG